MPDASQSDLPERHVLGKFHVRAGREIQKANVVYQQVQDDRQQFGEELVEVVGT